MKVILLEDVFGAGSAGDVVEVKNGYARNKLLPSGVALEANKANMKTLEHRRAKIAAKKAVDVDIAQDLAVRLEGKQVDFIAKAGEAGKLFGSITAHDIAAAVAATTGFEIDRRKLILDSPIKQVGIHEVRYRIYADVEAKIIVNVMAEGGSVSTPGQEEAELEIVEIKPEGEEQPAADAIEAEGAVTEGADAEDVTEEEAAAEADAEDVVEEEAAAEADADVIEVETEEADEAEEAHGDGS